MGRSKGYRIDVSQTEVTVRRDRREIRLPRDRWHYLVDVVDNFDGYHSAVAVEPSFGVYVVDYSNPRTHHVVSVGAELFYTSMVEETEDIKSYIGLLLLKPGDVVIDAGAYCGATTYAFSRAVGPAGRVVAIEADPQSFAALARNIDMHDLANVDLIEAALWSSSGSVPFSSEHALGSAVPLAGPQRGNVISVKALTLNDLCTRRNLRKVDAIKIDIEGAEYEALEASSRFFDEFRPRAVVEVHRTRHVSNGFERCESYFRRRGYYTNRQARNLLLCEPR